MTTERLDLVIMRHGEAEPFAASDAERPLTGPGRLVVENQARLLESGDFSPEQIIHSPFLRTTQTAEIMGSIFSSAMLSADTALLDSSDPAQVPYIWQGVESILLVSHMPLVGRLTHYLCPQSDIRGLSVAGFVRLEVNKSSLDARLVCDASGGLNG
jgi:phosphohistidine phosphatase